MERRESVPSLRSGQALRDAELARLLRTRRPWIKISGGIRCKSLKRLKTGKEKAHKRKEKAHNGTIRDPFRTHIWKDSDAKGKEFPRSSALAAARGALSYSLTTEMSGAAGFFTPTMW